MPGPSTQWILWSRDGSGEELDEARRRQQTGRTRATSTKPNSPPRSGAAPTPSESWEDAPAQPDHEPYDGPSAATDGVELAARRLRASSKGDSLIDQIIDSRSVQTVYQAVFDVANDQVVGFEALSRGPDGPLRSPAHLFAAARDRGRGAELDWVCRAAAFRDVIGAGLPAGVSLFVNVAPDSLIEPCPEDLVETIWEAEADLRVYVDITGKSLGRYPCQVLETVRRARAARWGVALADIEYSAAGIALLPVIEPDVVKLRYNTLTSGVGQVGAATMASLAEKEHGAAVLVERVEHSDASMIAHAIGATYQQGRALGREGALPDQLARPKAPLPLRWTEPPAVPRTPCQALRAGGAQRTTGVTQAGLDHLVSTIASMATNAAQAPMVAVTIATGFAPPLEFQNIMEILVDKCPLVVIIGEKASAWSDWRVRAADVPAGHPLARESSLVLLSPTLSMAVAAEPRGQAGSVEPEWSVMVSQNEELCRDVVRQLLYALDTLSGGVHHTDT